MSEEDPLEGLRVVVGVGDRIKGELPLRVVVLSKVKEDGGGLKDLEVATVRVDNSRAVRLCEIRWKYEYEIYTHMRPFGLIARNHGSFCLLVEMSSFSALCSKLSQRRETRRPGRVRTHTADRTHSSDPRRKSRP
jgi:hypothetical protein